MKTLLVPIDFTTTSENTVNYAAQWSKRYKYERIILLKSFYTSMYENVIMAGEFANVDQDYLNKSRAEEKKQIQNECERLREMAGSGIVVDSAVSELPLVRAVLEIIKSENPVMILLGSDYVNNTNEALISANVIAIAKISPIRVLIVPANQSYQTVEKILVPIRFDSIHSLDKINRLRASPQWHDVELFVLNVDTKQTKLAHDKNFKENEKSLHNYLKNFHHEIFYETNKNVIDGILNFEKINQVQLLIALPGVYSFLYSLTHKSISEALYRRSLLPVMILK